MSNLYVTEFAGYAPGCDGQSMPVVAGPPLAVQKIATSGVSAQSAAFNKDTTVIRVHADGIVSVRPGGTNPVATTSNPRMIAGQTEYFGVVGGDKIAVIDNT